MLAPLFLAALLAVSGVRDSAAAPAACSLPANSNCTLTQCPCYQPRQDHAAYARPAGCVAEVSC